MAAAVAVPVGDQVVGDPVQPGRERHAPIGIALDVVQGAVKNTGGQVFGVMDIACTVVDVVENPLYVLARTEHQRLPGHPAKHAARISCSSNSGT